MGESGLILWTRKQNFRSHQITGVSRLAEKLSAFQNGLRSTKLVTKTQTKKQIPKDELEKSSKKQFDISTDLAWSDLT